MLYSKDVSAKPSAYMFVAEGKLLLVLNYHSTRNYVSRYFFRQLSVPTSCQLVYLSNVA